MSDEDSNKTRQRIISWIVSLALSITLCASFFLDVKSQLLDAKRAHLDDEIKIETLEQRIVRISNDLNDLRRVVQPGQAFHPTVMDVTPPGMMQAAPDAPAASNGVSVFRGQLPANAAINAQPPAVDADVPNIQTPKLVSPVVPDANAPVPAPTAAPTVPPSPTLNLKP
jgi:hypothetical protein